MEEELLIEWLELRKYICEILRDSMDIKGMEDVGLELIIVYSELLVDLMMEDSIFLVF